MSVHAIAAVLGSLLFISGAPAEPPPPAEVPQLVREAFLPGGSVYQDAQVRTRAAAQSLGNGTVPTSTFSEPRRTNYIVLDPHATGPIRYTELSSLPQRYLSFQYIDGEVKARFEVGPTGEFHVVEDPDYQVAQKLFAFPSNGFHVTTWPYYEFWIPEDGLTFYALDASSEEFLGAPSVDSDTFRELDAARRLASEAEYQQFLADESLAEKALRNPLYLAVVLMFVAVGLAALFLPSTRRSRA